MLKASSSEAGYVWLLEEDPSRIEEYPDVLYTNTLPFRKDSAMTFLL